MHRKKIFLLIFLTVVSGMPVLPVAQRQKQDILSSHKYLVYFLLNPYSLVSEFFFADFFIYDKYVLINVYLQ